MCRASFAGVLEVPSLDSDPDGWFKACDVSGEGHLNPREVLDLIKAQFPIDYEKLEKDLPRLWSRWDPNGDGCISRQEFMASDGGLLTFIKRNFTKDSAAMVVQYPDIRNDKSAWFDFFDEDRSSELSIEEVTRALIKTHNTGTSVADVEGMRDLVANIWFIFDDDGSGTISRAEFLRGDGLADSVIASCGNYTR
mmetsp:Transcript_62594/g.86036  ORF Transcript_62594/g.86036 Transcript_62594/m.86036 type:complete len:195 (-) Transcript_62594:561-1145(-)